MTLFYDFLQVHQYYRITKLVLNKIIKKYSGFFRSLYHRRMTNVFPNNASMIAKVTFKHAHTWYINHPVFFSPKYKSWGFNCRQNLLSSIFPGFDYVRKYFLIHPFTRRWFSWHHVCKRLNALSLNRLKDFSYFKLTKLEFNGTLQRFIQCNE